MALTKDEFTAKLATIPFEEPAEEEKALIAKLKIEEKDAEYVLYTPPSQRKKHSGVMTLRLPPSLHDELTQLSQKENMSLNQYIVYTLGRAAESWKAQHS